MPEYPVRQLRPFSTGSLQVDVALETIHDRTRLHPEVFKLHGEAFDRFVAMLQAALEALPFGHSVRKAGREAYTSDAHCHWTPEQCKLRYQRITQELWPALDAIE